MPFVNTSGLDIHYETAGKGKEVIVLLHGNFASWRWWIPVLKRVPKGFRMVAPDLRGCGDTERPGCGHTIEQLTEDLLQFVNALGLRRFHLAGHSLGASVALQFALDHAHRVKRLVLVAPAPAEGRSVVLRAQRNGSFLSAMDTVDMWIKQWSGASDVNRQFVERILSRMLPDLTSAPDFGMLVEDANRMSKEAIGGHLQSLRQWNVHADLKTFRKPVLVMGGEKDELIPGHALKDFADRLRKGRLVLFPDLGHAPQLEAPDRFLPVFMGFFQEHFVKALISLMLKWLRHGRERLAKIRAAGAHTSMFKRFPDHWTAKAEAFGRWTLQTINRCRSSACQKMGGIGVRYRRYTPNIQWLKQVVKIRKDGS